MAPGPRWGGPPSGCWTSCKPSVTPGILTSTANPKVRAVRALAKPRERRARGVAVAEGIKVVAELAAIPERVEDLFAAESLSDRQDGRELISRLKAAGIPVTYVSDRVLAAMADARTPQGVLAVVRTTSADLAAVLARDGDLLVLDGVQDPGNVGTLVRTAEAAGLAGVMLTAGCADPTGPKCVRAAAGSLFRLPYVIWETAPSDLAEALEEAGLTVCAALKDGAVSPDHVTGFNRVAWVLGAEGSGVSDSLADRATLTVTIPMAGGVESLGVAAAGAVLMYGRRLAGR